MPSRQSLRFVAGSILGWLAVEKKANLGSEKNGSYVCEPRKDAQP